MRELGRDLPCAPCLPATRPYSGTSLSVVMREELAALDCGGVLCVSWGEICLVPHVCPPSDGTVALASRW